MWSRDTAPAGVALTSSHAAGRPRATFACRHYDRPWLRPTLTRAGRRFLKPGEPGGRRMEVPALTPGRANARGQKSPRRAPDRCPHSSRTELRADQPRPTAGYKSVPAFCPHEKLHASLFDKGAQLEASCCGARIRRPPVMGRTRDRRRLRIAAGTTTGRWRSPP